MFLGFILNLFSEAISCYPLQSFIFLKKKIKGFSVQMKIH